MLPVVSIMIPTYNQADKLFRAIESSLNQNYPELEIVISDDFSTDNTYEIVKKYLIDERVKYYRNDVNLGRVRNYKYTLENRVNGEWVINLDGDDYFIDNFFISRSIDLILSYTNVVFLQAGHLVKKVNDDKVQVCLPQINSEYIILDGKDYVINFLKFNHFSHSSTIYNRELAVSTNFYCYDILSTDIDSLLRLALKGSIILLKKPVSVWLQHENNVSKKVELSSFGKNTLWVYSVYNECLKYNLDRKKLLKWKKKLLKINLINDLKMLIYNADNLHDIKEIYLFIINNHLNLLFNLYVNKIFFKKILKLLFKK